MADFKIEQRVRLNPLHYYGYRDKLAGRYGVIKFEIDNDKEYGVMVDSCGLCFIHTDSIISLDKVKPELSDWTTIEAKTGFNPAKGNV